MSECQMVNIFPTDRMCNVMVLARREADARNSRDINTLDILYGIAQECLSANCAGESVLTVGEANRLWAGT